MGYRIVIEVDTDAKRASVTELANCLIAAMSTEYQLKAQDAMRNIDSFLVMPPAINGS